MQNDVLLDVRDLHITLDFDGEDIPVVQGIDFKLSAGKVLALVGESGCGKSLTSQALLRLLPRELRISSGQINFRDPDTQSTVDLASMPAECKAIRNIRGNHIAMIFQEPMASFAPAITIGGQMVEQLLIHTSMSKKEAAALSVEMLERVGINEAAKRFNQYAFELSGGMRQRAMIAMALSTKPKLLIADEPTTALDVTIQAQVLDLMKDLVAEFGMAILFITHDLGVIAQVADRVAVMYLGGIVESGPVAEVLRSPSHPYTKGLINALPKLDAIDEPLTPIPGDIPSPLERPPGCVFHTRCPEVIADRCNATVPKRTEVAKGHDVSCFALEAKGKAA